jgi:undecaprenyl-diphosphatase
MQQVQDGMSWIAVWILAIIEGLTEFLPVSSTGHMILTSSLMGWKQTPFLELFEVFIQLGAILAVLSLYYRRFLVGPRIYLKLLVAFLPTGIIGFVAYNTIKAYLFNPLTVSISLVTGGVLLVFLDRWSDRESSRYASVEEMPYPSLLGVGMMQCISMIPGVSRAAATIMGGVAVGLNRVLAAELSFLLALPTMFAASGYDLLKQYPHIPGDAWPMLLGGAAIAFVVALPAVKGFVQLVQRYGFRHFGYYRILIGLVFLALYAQGSLSLD